MAWEGSMVRDHACFLFFAVHRCLSRSGSAMVASVPGDSRAWKTRTGQTKRSAVSTASRGGTYDPRPRQSGGWFSQHYAQLATLTWQFEESTLFSFSWSVCVAVCSIDRVLVVFHGNVLAVPVLTLRCIPTDFCTSVYRPPIFVFVTDGGANAGICSWELLVIDEGIESTALS